MLSDKYRILAYKLSQEACYDATTASKRDFKGPASSMQWPTAMSRMVKEAITRSLTIKTKHNTETTNQDFRNASNTNKNLGF